MGPDGEDARIWVGRFDEDFTKIEEWVRVVEDGPGCRQSHAWIEQAETSKLEDVQPYTRSLTAAEYTVDEVLEGDWDKPTITVFHWMIMDSKRLPIADRPPGTKVELTVEPFTSHPQLQTSRRDELTATDFSAVLFYCEPAEAPAP